MQNDTNKILQSGDEQIRKLQEIVKKSIKDEKSILKNLLHEPREVLSKGQNISDKVASFGGSWKFIIIFSIILLLWIVFNTQFSPKWEFDPYPFILMNLVLSAIAALQAPIIMMSQNRKEEKDRKRNENDYLINLKAELELRSLHKKIDLLQEEQIKVLFETQATQLEILEKIQESLAGKK